MADRKIAMAILPIAIILIIGALPQSAFAASPNLSVPKSYSLTLADDAAYGLISIKVKNTGTSVAVLDVSPITGGIVSTWFVESNPSSFTLNPQETVQFDIKVTTPFGQAPGKYFGTVKFQGKDAQNDNVVSSNIVKVTITVPQRLSWAIQDPRACQTVFFIETCDLHRTVHVGDGFHVKADVVNLGNVPITKISGKLTLTKAFTSSNPLKIHTSTPLNNYGDFITLEWDGLHAIAKTNGEATLKVAIATKQGSQASEVFVTSQ